MTNTKLDILRTALETEQGQPLDDAQEEGLEKALGDAETGGISATLALDLLGTNDDWPRKLIDAARDAYNLLPIR